MYATGQPYLGNEVALRWRRQATGLLEEGFLNLVYQPYRGSEERIDGVLVHAVDVTKQGARARRSRPCRLIATAFSPPRRTI